MSRTAEAPVRPVSRRSHVIPGPASWPAAYLLSSVVAVLAGSASLIGLLVGGVYAQPASVAEMVRGYDLVMLVIAAPAFDRYSVNGRRRDAVGVDGLVVSRTPGPDRNGNRVATALGRMDLR